LYKSRYWGEKNTQIPITVIRGGKACGSGKGCRSGSGKKKGKEGKLCMGIVKKKTYKCIYFINQNHKTYISYKTQRKSTCWGKCQEKYPPFPYQLSEEGGGEGVRERKG
jgi:hypothetical protein